MLSIKVERSSGYDSKEQKEQRNMLVHPDTDKIDSESKRASLERRVSLNNEIFSTPGLNTQYFWEEKKN